MCSKALKRISHAEPRWQGVTALHPAKHPRNCAQVFQLPALGTPRGARTNLRMLQFIDRSGLIEIIEDIRIISDILPEKLKYLGLHLLHYVCPLLSRFSLWSFWYRE